MKNIYEYCSSIFSVNKSINIISIYLLSKEKLNSFSYYVHISDTFEA